ncbi:MAG: helix-turn-helix domain-containing protein [Candidatus Bathyarchaeota archaeon]
MKGDIKKTLLDIGFSDKEAQIYIYLGKRGPQNGRTIVKQLKINKGQVYRSLKSLQKNGAIECTLEYPARFTAVPLESVIDSYVKSKREEVDNIEKTKKDLISDWNNIRQIQIDSSLEKFSVIEGEKRVFHKISQLVKEAKKEVLTIVSVNALLKSDHYGIFDDIANHPLKDKIEIRFLTQFTKKDLKPIKMLLKKIESDFDFKGKDPERTSSICPRMVIKDNDEILLFISDPNEVSSKNKIEAVLCTNSKSIINSFHGVFQDLWSQGKPILRKIDELESGIKQPIMELIKEPQKAKIKYFKALDEGKTEIIMVTSSKHLHELAQNIDLIKKWRKKGLSTKILAPITNENLKTVQKLLTCCEVRHVPVGFKKTTIIDGNKLFEFNKLLILI